MQHAAGVGPLYLELESGPMGPCFLLTLPCSSGRGQAFRWQGIIAAVPSPGPKPPIFGREKLGSSGLHRCGGALDAPLGLVSPAPSEYVRSLGKMDPMRTPDPDLRN